MASKPDNARYAKLFAAVPASDIDDMKIKVYSWYGDPNLIAPYKHGEIVNGNPFKIANELFHQGLTVALRHTEFEIDGKNQYGILVMVSDSGFGQR